VSPSAPPLSVVIVNWNSRDDVLAGIRSLRAQTDPDLEIVVVDNGSTDGSVEAIAAAFPEVWIVQAGGNLGFAEGCNRGIEASHGEWVFLLNNDAVAEPDCVAELRRAAAEAPADVGMLQPLIVFQASPETINSTGIEVYRAGHAIDRHLALPVSAAEGAGEPFCATAGAALYRRNMLERVRLPTGYMSRDFFMYYEDVDLGWRCRLAGYRAAYVAHARVRHRFQGSARRRGASFSATQCRVNRIATLLHNASAWFILRTAPNSLYESLLVMLGSGPRPLLRLLSRVPALLAGRRVVGRLAVVPRSALERRWLAARAPAIPDLGVARGSGQA
jgi:GT2 family glycosyltransferase